MNFLFVMGGYNWLVIIQETKMAYLDALEAVSVSKNIAPFVDYIRGSIERAE